MSSSLLLTSALDADDHYLSHMLLIGLIVIVSLVIVIGHCQCYSILPLPPSPSPSLYASDMMVVHL